ncbi:MAG: M16 family metallopeptidase [Bacteroidota bacterium]
MIPVRPLPLRSPFAIAAVALALALALGAEPALAKSSAPPHVKLDVVKYTLPNGLDVILCENHRLPTVGVNVWYHVGPANEEPGRTGFAHLFEHMMFKGSRHVPDGKHWNYLQTAGATMVNGTTEFDRTNYLEDLPSNQLETALWLESDRMGFLLDGLDAIKLANQQDVVRNERRQSTENVEYGLAEEELIHQLFPKAHPYYADVIGSHEDIQAAKLDDVRAFFKRYYCPNNASLAIVGDIDVARTKALVAKYFGSIPRGAAVPPIRVVTPPITSERRAVVTDNVSLPRVYIAWIGPKAFAAGDADGSIVSDVLTGNYFDYGRGSSKASRLYRKLVYEMRIAQDVTSSYYPLQLGSIFQISATAKPGHTAEELEKAIDAEVAKLAAEGPTEAEVEAARQSVYLSDVSSLERNGWFNGIADRLNSYNYYVKNPDYFDKDLARYAAVTPQSAKRFVTQYLRKSSRAVVYGVPGEKKLSANVPTPPAPTSPGVPPPPEDKESWRNTPPSPASTTALALPKPTRFTLPNGLTVYHVEDHHLPLVTAQVVFRSGSAADPADLPGLASFTAGMVEEGTTTADALGIASRIHALGTSWETSFDMDHDGRGTECLSASAPTALSLLADVILHPTFPEAELDRVRQDRLASLIQEKDSPPETATRVFLAALYGADHPYGHTSLGTEEALKKIGRDDIVRYHAAEHTPANAALVVVGDIRQAEVRKLAQDLFGSWKGEATAPRAFTAGGTIGSRVLLVDKPGTPQTRLLVGQLAVPRKDPDYDALSLMNTVMGGGFTSRINQNLREKNGYTYGTYSSLTENAGPGRIVVAGGIRTDVTGPAIGEILKEVRGMKDQPVTDAELQRVRGARIQALPGRFETSRSVAEQVGSLFAFGLPDDYFQSLPGRLGAITADDLTAMARKYLVPERMLIVAVGDRAKIAPQLEPLGLGPVAVRDTDGRNVDAQATEAK